MVSQSQDEYTPQVAVTSVDPDTAEPTQRTVDLSQTAQGFDQKIRGYESEINLLTDGVKELTNKKHLLGHLRARNRGSA